MLEGGGGGGENGGTSDRMNRAKHRSALLQRRLNNYGNSERFVFNNRLDTRRTVSSNCKPVSWPRKLSLSSSAIYLIIVHYFPYPLLIALVTYSVAVSLSRSIYFLHRHKRRKKENIYSSVSFLFHFVTPPTLHGTCEFILRAAPWFFQVANKSSLFQSIPPLLFRSFYFPSISPSALPPFFSLFVSFFRHGFNRPNPPRPRGVKSLAGDSMWLF